MMTDIDVLLDSAAGAPAHPSAAVVEADLRRGRRALVRRRRWQGASVAGLTAAVAAGAFVVSPWDTAAPDTVRVVMPAVAPVADDPPNPGLDLVDFHGPRHGARFRPAEVPDGWTVSGDENVLLVSPPGYHGVTSPGAVDFRDRLTVSFYHPIPGEPLPKDQQVQVGDKIGYVIPSDAGTIQVWLPIGDHLALRAQAPASTGWDAATLGRFLGGVSVLKGADLPNGEG